MKKSLLTLFIFFSLFSGAQNPLLKMWDYRYGGTYIDQHTCFIQVSDGGYILGGSSASGIGGDKTQPLHGSLSSDFWIVKIDSMGNKQWDKDFGGINDDVLLSIQQTRDGGYILGGLSSSGISGDKSQMTWGSYDYWIVKTDSNGMKQWDKDFGGTDNEELTSLEQTSDGGYILGGFSYSPSSGDKSQPTTGILDYWVVKIDSLGNKQWDKDFGGINNNLLYSLQQTTDGGYILGGYSNSPAGGNKSQNTKGGTDYWIIKTDSSGNIQWDKDFGGTDAEMFYSLNQTSDKGYILGGWSHSGNNGDKTEPNHDVSGNTGDYWIVKIDSLGNKQWDKDFGGTNYEELYSLKLTDDGGYLISGDSYSPSSGDKSENNMGLEQTWVVKTDSIGNKIWDKTILTPGHDETGLSMQTRDGCYLFANYANSGSVTGGYRTQPTWSSGDPDYWVIKFCEVPTINFAATTNFCPGTCSDFTNLSTNATSYQWSFPGATPDTSTDVNPQNICYANSGSFDVQLIASNANGIDTLLLSNYINVYPTPSPQSITQSGDTLFANAGATSYQWYFNTNIINGVTDYFYIAPASGDYNVVATDGNGCEVEAAVFNVVAGLTLTLSKGEGINLYPNPIGEKLRVSSSAFGEAAVDITIYNVTAEMVLAVRLPIANCLLHTCEIDVSQIPPGMYWIELESGAEIFRTKFVKE